jgi:hypothetical protein
VRKAVFVVVAAALVLALLGLGYQWWSRSQQSDFAQAVAGAPEGAERLSWTDWAGVRRELGSDVDAQSDTAELTAFLDDGYDADPTSRSALLQSAPLDGLDAATEAMSEPLSAAVYSGDYACAALAMGQADADDQAEAAELVSAAGTVDPYLAFAMGVRAGGEVRVAMEFANDDQARANADSSAALATGPAVGQGGEFADRFGPVLFATC